MEKQYLNEILQLYKSLNYLQEKRNSLYYKKQKLNKEYYKKQGYNYKLDQNTRLDNSLIRETKIIGVVYQNLYFCLSEFGYYHVPLHNSNYVSQEIPPHLKNFIEKVLEIKVEYDQIDREIEQLKDNFVKTSKKFCKLVGVKNFFHENYIISTKSNNSIDIEKI